jgi:hypothetical protein
MDWDPDERDGAVRLPVDVGSAGLVFQLLRRSSHTSRDLTPKQLKHFC